MWVTKVVVEHNDVGKVLRLLLLKIEALARNVPRFIALPGGISVTKQFAISDLRPGDRRFEIGLDENGDIPVCTQFGTQEEDAVEKQYCIRSRKFALGDDLRISSKIKRGAAKSP